MKSVGTLSEVRRRCELERTAIFSMKVFGGKVHIWRILGAWQDTRELSEPATKVRWRTSLAILMFEDLVSGFREAFYRSDLLHPYLHENAV